MADITKYFRLNGISIRSDAANFLAGVVKGKHKEERSDILEQVVKFLQRQSEDALVISRADVELAVKEFSQQDDTAGQGAIWTEFFWVYDIFSIPRLIYDDERKHYARASATGSAVLQLHENAEWKNLAYVERYNMLFQRCLRNPLFVRSSREQEEDQRRKEDELQRRRNARRRDRERAAADGTQIQMDLDITRLSLSGTLLDESDDNNGPQTFILRTIEELLSSSTPIHNTVVLGMLSSLQEGKYHLEDPTGAVELEIGGQTAFHSGLYIENVFVIVEGWYEERLLHVTGMGMPPPEPRYTTQLNFGDFNFFGGASQVALKASAKLRRFEQAHADEMFVIMSDIWLDNEQVLSKLDLLFRGFQNAPPYCFVLCGDFISRTENVNHPKMLKDGLRALWEILRKYPTVLSSKMVFVPGPADVGGCGLLPRQLLPESLTEEFRLKVKNAIFTTNPCRIQYCTKEIMVVREDILTKMCRTLIREPISDGNIPRYKNLSLNLARTIACQGHLCPLPLHILPTCWSFDHVFRLYALPDLIVMADIQEPFIERDIFLRKKDQSSQTQDSQADRDGSASCLIANPSSFPRHSFQFHVYFPCQNSIEASQID